MVIANMADPQVSKISEFDVVADVDAILQAVQATELFRFHRQRFWEAETSSTDSAGDLGILETVAAHSWGVADAALLLQPHFPDLNGNTCLRLAILHDKPELISGDLDPLGEDGTGLDTHAFNVDRQLEKAEIDRAAAREYAQTLRPQIAERQLADLLQYIAGTTAEARFVKAVDKIQALAYVVVKKKSGLVPSHMDFTIRFSRKAIDYFPRLSAHYFELRSRLVSI